MEQYSIFINNLENNDYDENIKMVNILNPPILFDLFVELKTHSHSYLFNKLFFIVYDLHFQKNQLFIDNIIESLIIENPNTEIIDDIYRYSCMNGYLYVAKKIHKLYFELFENRNDGSYLFFIACENNNYEMALWLYLNFKKYINLDDYADLGFDDNINRLLIRLGVKPFSFNYENNEDESDIEYKIYTEYFMNVYKAVITIQRAIKKNLIFYYLKISNNQ